MSQIKTITGKLITGMEANESAKQNTDNWIGECVLQFPIQALQQDYDYQEEHRTSRITTHVSLLNYWNTRDP